MKSRKSSLFHLSLVVLACLFDPYAFAENRLRVGTLTLSPQRKLLLLGVSSYPLASQASLDFKALGFEGRGLENIDPKFLLEISPEGITEVRSFELEDLSEKSFKKVPAELPPVLLQTGSARDSKWNHAAANAVAGTCKYFCFPISTSAILGRLPEKYDENLKKLKATYLMEWVNKALPPWNRFPELTAALANNPEDAEKLLNSLGRALLIRYHPESNSKGLHVTEDDDTFFTKWRAAQDAIRSDNKAYLTHIANRVGLKLIHVSNDFAYVFIDANIESNLPADKKFQAKFMGLGSPSLNLQEILSSQKFSLSSSSLIPWYLISFVNPEGPVDLVNFIYPGKLGLTLKGIAQAQLGVELGGSFLPLFHWPVQKINTWTKLKTLEEQDTRYLRRIAPYGSASAISEAQSEEINPLLHVSYEPLQRTPLLDGLDFSNNMILENQGEDFYKASAILSEEEERLSRLWTGPNIKQKAVTKEIYLERIKKFIFKEIETPLPKGTEKTGESVLQTSARRASRSPCSSEAPVLSPDLAKKKAVLIFMIDGLRPDRFRQAAEAGYFPNLKKIFIERGTELESYAYRSLTLPSWTSFFSGKKPDFHGIRSNHPTSRVDRSLFDNFEDARKDFLNPKNHHRNRAFRKLEESTEGEGKAWFPDYYAKEQVLYNYMPISKEGIVPLKEIFKDLFKNNNEFVNGVRLLPNAFDSASAIATAKKIRQDEAGNLRLVMNWYSGVDEMSHLNNRMLPIVYREIDQGIGRVLDAAREHPALKNATIVLVSDHGHSGGFGPFDEKSTIYSSPLSTLPGVADGPLLVNTGFHLTEFLAGDFREYSQYNFVIGTANAPEPKFDLSLMKELHLLPYQITYPSNRGSATALVDASGDSLAQIYIKSNPKWDRLNFFQLSHFKGGARGEYLNIPADMLEVKMDNLMVTDPGLTRKIRESSGSHPVELFAMALSGEAAKVTADLLGSNSFTGPSTREPVLVMSRGDKKGEFRTALILTKSDTIGNDKFRYVVLKEFSQNSAGEITGKVSADPNSDPLKYLGTIVPGPEAFSEWHTDREWLKLARYHSKPTVIFSLPGLLTLAPKFVDGAITPLSSSVKQRRQGEVPDFIISATPGFGFHSDEHLESDHGGFIREEVRNTLFLSSLDRDRFRSPTRSTVPVFNFDLMPTILELSGFDLSRETPIPTIQGQSFKEILSDF